MNPDLHMAGELKNTGKGNLFVVFGEPDIEIDSIDGGDALRVKVKGVDVFDPNTGEIRSDDTDGIAAWFIDTDYDEESFFVRHAYFLGANDPYKSLKTALQRRDRRGGLGDALPRHLAPVRAAEHGAHRGEGHQPLRRRGDEGVWGVGAELRGSAVSKTVDWYPKIKDQSLALAVREAGFDLTMFEEYSEETQSEIRKRAIKIVLRNIADEFEDITGKTLGHVSQGVYVIGVSNPFTVGYGKGSSEVIYIGIGKIASRLESHFNNSLFDFMMSVAGANFDFYLTEPNGSPGDLYYKHIEYMLLEKFREKHGSYPLLNTNAGSRKEFEGAGAGWDKPLKGSGKKPVWEIRPTKHCDFAKLDE